MRVAPINRFNYDSNLRKNSNYQQNIGAVSFKKGRECSMFFSTLFGLIAGGWTVGRTAAETGEIDVQTVIGAAVAGAFLGGLLGYKIDKDSDDNSNGFSAKA